MATAEYKSSEISFPISPSVLTTLGLHSLQHRGQEGAGIVSFDGNNFHSVRKQGLVGDNFNNTNILSLELKWQRK